jgi:hypothetical protein
MKKIIKEELEDISLMLWGEVKGAIDILTEYELKYKRKYDKITIEADYNHFDGHRVFIYGQRLETDKEYEDREIKESKYINFIKEKKIEERERKTLRALIKKYPEELKNKD